MPVALGDAESSLNEARQYLERVCHIGGGSECTGVNDLRFALAVADECETHLNVAKEALENVANEENATILVVAERAQHLGTECEQIGYALNAKREAICAQVSAIEQFNAATIDIEDRLLAAIQQFYAQHPQPADEDVNAVHEQLVILDADLKKLEQMLSSCTSAFKASDGEGTRPPIVARLETRITGIRALADQVSIKKDCLNDFDCNFSLSCSLATV